MSVRDKAGIVHETSRFIAEIESSMAAQCDFELAAFDGHAAVVTCVACLAGFEDSIAAQVRAHCYHMRQSCVMNAAVVVGRALGPPLSPHIVRDIYYEFREFHRACADPR